ncbi:spore maturation protein [Oceanobacillus luteolus]|uniref:nucleoside recognition domain-containing protein n=1 Tax=Oceanobacillus luteolus TaxID=1274358 RepID=UPI002040B76B|nr:nucleoside recognition domain-containing protein [Oceanobacillus luteolus]MCM3738823.1 spore maturation protein [Oceanobacillus luteolus]
MVNLIWACMIIFGILFAIFNGTMNEVNKAIIESAGEAVTLSIGLISILVFWLGVMKIAEAAGILKVITKIMRPMIVKIFPEIPKDHPAMGYILSNFTANFFGLGNAATPLGIKAMQEMKKLSGSDVASRSMITFLAINTSSLTLIPTTVIAIRMQYNSTSPTEIVATTLIASLAGVTSAVLIDRYYYKKESRRK